MTNDTTTPGAGEELKRTPHVFLDCDGVLADFDRYAEAYFGMPSREYEAKVGSKRFWAELEAKGDFYRDLPLMADAKALFEGVKHLNPTILTGCPRGNWAQGQKVAWAAEHFPGVPIITCRSADKRDYAKPGDVLIDDWAQHRHRWIEMGGVFITHHCAETSLAALWAHYPALRATASVTTASGNEEVAATVSPPIREAKNPVPTRPVAGEGETKPVAYLVQWWDAGRYCTRVQLSDVVEPWLDALKPTLTPLGPLSSPEAWKPDREAVAKIIDPWPFGIVACISYNERAAVEREKAFAKADAILALARPSSASFQDRVGQWGDACFGADVMADELERSDRAVEEFYEALQSRNYPRERLVALEEYVWNRPVGETRQEIGGVMLTLAAWCRAMGVDMMAVAEAELARVWTKVETIRAKQAAKPKGSALPIALPTSAKGGA